MSDIAKMDIFFVITTIAVLVIGALVALVLIRLLRILRNVEKVSDIVTEESQLLRRDIAELRTSVQTEGFKWKAIAKFFRTQVEKITRTKKA